MRFKYKILAVIAALMVVALGTYQYSLRAQASTTVEPEAQPQNTIVRWVRETQTNKMGEDIVMTLGYNHDGNPVVSILENKKPIITVTTYDAQGNTVQVRSFDDGKQFVNSTYTYNEHGDQTSWLSQARTPEGVNETEYTYEYVYDDQGLIQKDSYQDGKILSRETYEREQTEEGTVVRKVTEGDMVPDLTCYDQKGNPLWREKDTYRMVYYYDRLGRETENCVIDDGMQQNRTVTVYGEDGYPIRRILYGANQQDVISVSEIQTLTATPKLWLAFSEEHETTAIITGSQSAQKQEETQEETQEQEEQQIQEVPEQPQQDQLQPESSEEPPITPEQVLDTPAPVNENQTPLPAAPQITQVVP